MEQKTGAQWIDMYKATEKDLEFLRSEFHVHPIILEELKKPSARARVEHYKQYLYLAYHFPVYDAREASTSRAEIGFIVTKNAVAVVHDKKLEPLEGMARQSGGNTVELLYRAIESLLHFQERQLRHIGEKVEAIGGELFKNQEQKVLIAISYLKRDISEYRIVVRLQEAVLRSLLAHGAKFWGDDAQIYLSDLVSDHSRIVNQLENFREAVRDFEDTTSQLMNFKINSVMKTFTILSFLTFPFMLIAALFSMNTPGMPGINFWALVAAMAVVMLGLTFYFRRKGWF